MHQHLPCVPETKPGAARIFDRDGIVMLKIFSTLLKQGMSSIEAGKIACAVHSKFQLDYKELVNHLRYYFKPDFYPDDIDPPVLMFMDDGNVFISNDVTARGIDSLFSASTSYLNFPIRALRVETDKQLQWHQDNPVLGESD
ncbi:hypothetical protein EOK75_18200 (plasmid) [Pseudorhodobacter turbinis]|uniref:Uncharacterized protein n=2 Tax=Pseudorhodobacter turbinis TaxID=2500533 RepID=A0A4P8EK97_9RHOB|nr:hypothetical protein EOK75_18200 [Pseudorhodobacter turbinis]